MILRNGEKVGERQRDRNMMMLGWTEETVVGVTITYVLTASITDTHSTHLTTKLYSHPSYWSHRKTFRSSHLTSNENKFNVF